MANSSRHGTRGRLLESIHEQLADAADLSLVLLSADGLRSFTANGSGSFESFLSEVCMCPWSNPDAFVDLFRQEPKALQGYLVTLKRFADDLAHKANSGVWKPQVFVSPLGVLQFLAPLARLEEKSDGTFDKHLVAFLLGGSVWIESQNPSLSYVDLQLNRFQKAQGFRLTGSRRHRLTFSILGSPIWPNEKTFLRTAKHLRLAFNGMLRTYIESTKGLPRDFEYRTAAIELYRSVERMDAAYVAGLNEVLKFTPGCQAALLVTRHPITKTGFTLLKERDKEEDPGFLHKPEDFDAFVSAEHFSEIPDHLRKYVTPGFEVVMDRQFPICSRSCPGPSELDGLLWLLRDARPRFGRRVVSRKEETQIESFLRSCQVALVLRPDQIRLTELHAYQRDLAHRRHLLRQRMVDSAFSLDVEMLEVLQSVKDIVGFRSGAYHRALLYRDPPCTEVEADTMGKAGRIEPLTPEVLERLFQRRQALVPLEGSTALLPVIHGNRTLGYARLEFSSTEEMKKSLPIAAEFACLLAARVPYHRTYECINDIINDMRKLAADEATEGNTFNSIAGRIALLLGEDGCSIWLFDSAKDKFQRIGGAGLKMPARSYPRKAKSGVAYTLDAGELQPARFELKDDSVLPATVHEALLKQGFMRGVGLASSVSQITVVVVVWSKSKEGGFTKEDVSLLRLPVYILAQVQSLRTMFLESDKLRDQTLCDLGHELKSPVGGVFNAIEYARNFGYPVGERRHMLEAVSHLAQYLTFLIENLTLFERIQEPEYKLPTSGSRTSCSLFGDIVDKAGQALRAFTLPQGMSIVPHIDSGRDFPTSLLLTGLEQNVITSILFNLLSNAVKFAARAKNKTITVIGQSDRNYFYLKIRDYGIGVPEGEEEHIFEKGERGANAEQGIPPTGSGFGLYISRRLAELLGGSLDISSPREPTEFTLKLPRVFGTRPH